MANEMKTVAAAKTIVQTKTRMNGSRTSGFLAMLRKLFQPMYVFQPGSSSSLPATNEPRPLSLKTLPSEMRTKTPRFAS